MRDWLCELTGHLPLFEQVDGRYHCLCTIRCTGAAYAGYEYNREARDTYMWTQWKYRLCGLMRHRIVRHWRYYQPPGPPDQHKERYGYCWCGLNQEVEILDGS